MRNPNSRPPCRVTSFPERPAEIAPCNARGESRTLMGLPPTDFESVASAIPPLGLGGRNLVDREGAPHLRPYACARAAAHYAPPRRPPRNTRAKLGGPVRGTC